jgi:DNA modification methylase
MNLTEKDKEIIKKCLDEGKPVPSIYRQKLFASDDTEYVESTKDYKLVYKGKARKEDIIANTPAAPLQKIRSFNSDNCFEEDWSNMLIFGDNLLALKAIYEDQQGPNIYKTKNKIKLIYIDPPFATKQDFMKDREKAYRDKIIGAQFIEFLRKRLILLREILAEDGSIFVHLDWKKGHYIKAILDEVFGEHNFKNEIIWTYYGPGSPKMKQYNRKHDTIFWYSRGSSWIFNADSVRTAHDEKTKGNFKDGLRGSGFIAGEYEIPDGKVPEDHWLIAIAGRYPMDGVKRVGYPTEKPLPLLERIILGSSNEGDIVLDAFGGSGISACVSEYLNRKWIAIDCGKLSVYTIQSRICKMKGISFKEMLSGKIRKVKGNEFTLYHAGIYDNQLILQMDWEQYKPFVAKLFGVRLDSHKVHSHSADGFIGTNSTYIWDYPNQKDLLLDEEYVKTLHQVLGGKAGDKFYVIAPISSLGFMQDEITHGDTTYVFLKVPLSVLMALINKGEPGALKQPASETDVNEVMDAIGFDFISQPVVKASYQRTTPPNKDLFNASDNDFIVELTEFKSNTLAHDPEDFENFETFSMVMVDTNYNGDYFHLNLVFWADKIVESTGDKAIIRIPEKDFTGDKLMVIFMDKYGNELKVIRTKTDFV